jgi:hypothetical protein
MTMQIRPIFNKDAFDYPFEGCQLSLPKTVNMDFKYIVNTLREHLGDDLYFTEENGRFILPYSEEDLETIKRIYSDTGDFPIKIGRSYLWFEIVDIIID